ncbi:hypothetical protein [Streptomyces sp. SP17KL33]|uniref:hypothetical protein n=1 Tax=Streptomyces sp. SP17KL33 TaxID=3002534 RepID=UPI002E763D79|nr:hypothetical protein [Streptomyces sp. SP17KL33]MEE1830496.1 hypothetical protein [Streptomyces sp. SP17KL33]
MRQTRAYRHLPAARVQDLVIFAVTEWLDHPDREQAFVQAYGRVLTGTEPRALRCLTALDAVNCLARGAGPPPSRGHRPGPADPGPAHEARGHRPGPADPGPAHEGGQAVSDDHRSIAYVPELTGGGEAS